MRQIISTTTLLFSMVFFTLTATAEVNDPFENINRKVHSFNTAADKAVLKPLAQGYKFITPAFIRKGVSNFFDNLLYPNTIINQFLQGNGTLGLQDTGRFILNSTVGVAGVFDVAKKIGLNINNEDFGQTFAVWGFGSGSYIVIPFLGPSTTRDSIGNIAGIYTNPITYIRNNDKLKYSLYGLSLLDTRYRLLNAEDLISGDKYLFIRDAYLQKRDFLINNGAEENDPFLDD